MEIIPIAPAPQQNASSAKTTRGAADTDGESGFGLMLDQAGTQDNATRQTPAQSSPNGQNQTKHAADQATTAPGDHATAEPKGEVTLEAEADPLEPADASPTGFGASAEQNLLALLFATSTATAGRQQTLFSWQTPAGPMLNPALQLLTETGAPIELPAAVQNGLTVALENGANSLVPAAGAGRHMDALLAQIQALISAHNDQVTVTATFQPADRTTLPGYLSGPLVDALLAGSSARTSQQASLLSGLPGEQPPIVADPLLQKNADLSLTALRQEQAGSELHARLAVFRNSTGEQSNEHSGQQPTQHQATTSQQTSLTLLPQGDANGTSHGFTAQFQETASQQQAAAASRLSGQPSSFHAQHVVENDVIGQIIQRFSLHTSLQTSRLNIKLHPAELGELKISLVVKEDSLKANIYAQTRQAQEIIEKHLPRLKTVLEEQGLIVEDLIVTLESDFLEDSSSQQSQSFAQQMSDFSREQRGRGDNNLFGQSLEDLPAAAEHDPLAPSGVNLTV